MGKFEALTSEYIAELLQRQDRLQNEAIVKQLTEETRLAILWIKDV